MSGYQPSPPEWIGHRLKLKYFLFTQFSFDADQAGHWPQESHNWELESYNRSLRSSFWQIFGEVIDYWSITQWMIIVRGSLMQIAQEHIWIQACWAAFAALFWFSNPGLLCLVSGFAAPFQFSNPKLDFCMPISLPCTANANGQHYKSTKRGTSRFNNIFLKQHRNRSSWKTFCIAQSGLGRSLNLVVPVIMMVQKPPP